MNLKIKLKLEEFLHPEKASANLCMFFSILNALPTKELKAAFCGNEDGSQKFENATRGWKTKEQICRTGYTERDMRRYLEILKEENIISSYVWKRKKSKSMSMHKIWKNPPKGNTVYVLFGVCTTGENRQRLIKRLERKNKQATPTEAEIQEQIQKYHSYTPVQRETTDHAVAITGEQGALVLSDTGRQKKHRIVDMTVLAYSLVCVYCVYVFELKV